MKVVVLKCDLHDAKLRTRAMKKVVSVSGVESVSVGVTDMRMTVIGNVDPVDIVSKLRKLLHTEIISVGPAREKEKEKGKDKNPEGTLTPLISYDPLQMQPSQVPPLTCSDSYRSSVRKWGLSHRGDALLASMQTDVEIELRDFIPLGMYSEKNVGPIHRLETNPDLGLGLKSALPITNLRGSLDTIPSLDLEIGMNSHYLRKEIEMCLFPDGRYNGVLQSPKSQVISCIQLEEDTNKVGDRIPDITVEFIQTEVTSCLAWFELKPDHCSSMNIEEIYISKSPSLQFCAYNFVSLFFPYCKRRQLWKGEEQLLVSLKYLDAKYSNLLWIPNLSKAQKLKSLNLEGCVDLVGVSSIQYLKKLQHLNLKGCQSLKGLPSVIRLKLLKTLDLSHCSNLTRLPPSLGCLPTLCELNLKNCEKLENLPRSVMHLMRSLKTLNISGCTKMLKSFGRYENGVSSLAQPPSAMYFVPSLGATQEEDLPSNDIPISKSTEETCLQPQPITVVQEDSPGDLVLQDLSSDLQDITAGEAVESEDDDSMTISLIISLLSKLRAALSFPPYADSSYASSSSSQDYNTLPMTHTEDISSESEFSKIAATPYMEHQQQLCKDDDSEDAKREEKPLSPSVEPIFCQVQDCEVDLTRKNHFHQQHKICEVHSNASESMVGNILQRFCHQCCRFHDLIDFDEGERKCRTRLVGYHQKHRMQTNLTNGTKELSSPTTELYGESNTTESDENERCLLYKRTKTSGGAIEQNHPTHPLENQLRFSTQDWDEANAIGNIEEDILAFIEKLSCLNDKEKEVPESVLAWLAEMEQSVPEMVRRMKSAKAEAAMIGRKRRRWM